MTHDRGQMPARALAISVLAAVALGCGHTQTVPGPPAPRPGDVSRIVVTAIENEGTTIIRDRTRIDALSSSAAFSQAGWFPGDQRDLKPIYRIDFHGHSRSTYWLGTYPPAVSAPVYFYSTWWVSPSTPAGVVDRTRIKGLADTTRYRLFQDLGL